MATTLRLSPALQGRVDVYAKSLGVSVASVVAIALADYLDARDRVGGGSPAAVEAPPVDPNASKGVREGLERSEALSPSQRVQETARLARLGKRAKPKTRGKR